MKRSIFLTLFTIALLATTMFAQERRVDYIQTCGVAGSNTSGGNGVNEAAATNTIQERGNCQVHVTRFTFTAMPLTLADATQGGGKKIYTFPEGRVLILGATGSVQVTTTSTLASTLNASVSCRWGIGTTTQANATLATTEQDILPVTTFTSSATINVINTATTAALASSAQFDGTSTAKAAFFNISVPTATDIDADATVNVDGSATITWIWLGDF